MTRLRSAQRRGFRLRAGKPPAPPDPVGSPRHNGANGPPVVTRSDPRATLVPLGDLDAGQLARWEELAQHASEPNPFFEPSFVLPAAAALGDRVALLVCEDGDGWCGCMPVQKSARARGWKHVPAQGLVAWTHLYCFLGTPLLRKGSEAAAARPLIREGAAGGFLGFKLLAADGPVAQALLEAPDAMPQVKFDESERAALRKGAEGWDLRLGGKRVREIRRQRRRLAESAGGGVKTADRTGDRSAVERFLGLEASGWKAAKGTALRSEPAHAELFRRICRTFDERGRLQLLSLEAGGSTYAMLCSFVASDTLFEFKIAFDERAAHVGPGIQIETDAVEMMASVLPDVRLIDSCAGPSNAMANRLFPDRIRLETVGIPGGSAGRRNLALIRAALKTRNAIRRLR